MFLAASSHSACVLDTKSTFPPAEAMASAMARPSPFEPPVIMAAFPVMSNNLIPGSFDIFYY
jgi:hypothetical protein